MRPAILDQLLLSKHIYLFRRHGITPKKPLRKPDEAFWPEQVLKDSVACLAVLATVLILIWLPRLRDADAPLGADLGAPADPSQAFSAARPEWYFLFLFQFLKYFPGSAELIGAIVGVVIIPIPEGRHIVDGRRIIAAGRVGWTGVRQSGAAVGDGHDRLGEDGVVASPHGEPDVLASERDSSSSCSGELGLDRRRGAVPGIDR